MAQSANLPESKPHHSWFGDDPDQFESFPFFNSDTLIDFPFIKTTSLPNKMSTNTMPVEEVDLKPLVIHNCFPPPQIIPKQNKSPVLLVEHETEKVPFVKEYKRRNRKTFKNLEDRPMPRRNPKRNVRTLSKDLRMLHDGTSEKAVKQAEHTDKNEYTDERYKEWPVDVPEQPSFNQVAKRLEKLPTSTGKSRKRTRRKRKTENTESEDSLSTEFAALAHQNLHYILMYINNVKEYNLLRKDSNSTTNLDQATDLLKNASIMYCLANNVPRSALARYLDSITAEENIGKYLKSTIDECEAKLQA